MTQDKEKGSFITLIYAGPIKLYQLAILHQNVTQVYLRCIPAKQF